KIDVEGAENRVLTGARATLSAPNAPLLIIEMNRDALIWSGTSAEELARTMIEVGYEPMVLEVAASWAYANLVGVKEFHQHRFPLLARYGLQPLEGHEWYRSHVLGQEGVTTTALA